LSKEKLKLVVFVTAIFGAAFLYEVAFDSFTDRLWDNMNKGVRFLSADSPTQRQWKDIEHKYKQQE
jgi:ubiquinol-cytochrome c reductase subunit 9